MNKAVFRIPLNKIKITGKSFVARNVFCGIKEEIVLPKKWITLVASKLGHLELSTALSSHPLA